MDFTNLIKVGIKLAIVTAVLGSVVLVVSMIQIPNVDFSSVSYYIGSVYAFAVHWCPVIDILWATALGVIGVNIAILGVRAALFVARAIMVVFE